MSQVSEVLKNISRLVVSTVYFISSCFLVYFRVIGKLKQAAFQMLKDFSK